MYARLMLELTIIQQITVWIIPVLFAITIHEAAHAWAADRLGDTTAKNLGRLSFNPLKHIDLMGTVLVPFATLILSNFNFVFGWAKPVPINPLNFKHFQRDIALSSAAGPMANLVMAIIWTALMKLAIVLLNPQVSVLAVFIILMAQAGIIINAVLMLLNLIPIPPLDGSKIVMALLPPKAAAHYEKIAPFGFFILLALLLTGALSWVLSPALRGMLQLLRFTFQL